MPLNAIGPILRQKQSAEMLNAVAPLKSYASIGNDYDQNVLDNLTTVDAESEILSYLRGYDTTRQQKIEESYQTMEAVADVLHQNAGIRDFRKILSSYPHVFFVNVTNVVELTNYLRYDVGMTKEDMAKAIQTYPRLLEQDVSKVSDVVDFLISIEVDEEAIPIILRSFPPTIMLDIENNMIPVVEFLQEIGVRNIGRFVT